MRGLVVVRAIPAAARPAHVGPRAGHVVGGQPLVEGQADGEGQQLLGRALVAEAAVPEGHRPAPAPG